MAPPSGGQTHFFFPFEKETVLDAKEKGALTGTLARGAGKRQTASFRFVGGAAPAVTASAGGTGIPPRSILGTPGGTASLPDAHRRGNRAPEGGTLPASRSLGAGSVTLRRLRNARLPASSQSPLYSPRPSAGLAALPCSSFPKRPRFGGAAWVLNLGWSAAPSAHPRSGPSALLRASPCKMPPF